MYLIKITIFPRDWDSVFYMCYQCQTKSTDTSELITHCCTHIEGDDRTTLSLRRLQLDEVSGNFGYKSVNFSVTLRELKSNISDGLIPHLNESSLTLSYKRKWTVTNFEACHHQPVCADPRHALFDDFCQFLDILDRKDDFVSVIQITLLHHINKCLHRYIYNKVSIK